MLHTLFGFGVIRCWGVYIFVRTLPSSVVDLLFSPQAGTQAKFDRPLMIGAPVAGAETSGSTSPTPMAMHAYMATPQRRSVSVARPLLGLTPVSPGNIAHMHMPARAGSPSLERAHMYTYTHESSPLPDRERSQPVPYALAAPISMAISSTSSILSVPSPPSDVPAASVAAAAASNAAMATGARALAPVVRVDNRSIHALDLVGMEAVLSKAVSSPAHASAGASHAYDHPADMYSELPQADLPGTGGRAHLSALPKSSAEIVARAKQQIAEKYRSLQGAAHLRTRSRGHTYIPLHPARMHVRRRSLSPPKRDVNASERPLHAQFFGVDFDLKSSVRHLKDRLTERVLTTKRRTKLDVKCQRHQVRMHAGSTYVYRELIITNPSFASISCHFSLPVHLPASADRLVVSLLFAIDR